MSKDKFNPNQHIANYLDYYCNLKSPGFAVMLDGEWGCGKTWFAKKYRNDFNCNNKEKKILYISLNGISSLGEIDGNLLLAIAEGLGNVSSKIPRNAQVITRKLLKAANSIPFFDKFKPIIHIIDFIEGLSISNKFVIVFDDLERCNISIELSMGYINSFVEHLGMNAIIIGNSTKLPDKKGIKVQVQ